MFSDMKASQWTHDEVLALIMEVESKKDELDNPTLKKCEVWNRIADKLNSEEFYKSSAMCEKKWNNLKIPYF